MIFSYTKNILCNKKIWSKSHFRLEFLKKYVKIRFLIIFLKLKLKKLEIYCSRGKKLIGIIFSDPKNILSNKKIWYKSRFGSRFIQKNRLSAKVSLKPTWATSKTQYFWTSFGENDCYSEWNILVSQRETFVTLKK